MGNNQVKYILFVTTNVVNNKIYVGVHETEEPGVFDGYLGDGIWVDTPLSYNRGKSLMQCAILKYGVKSFKRHTLRVFDDDETALRLLDEIVTPEFVSLPSNYNYTITTTPTIYKFNKEGISDSEGEVLSYLTEVKPITEYINQYNKEGILIAQYPNAAIAAQKLDLDKNAINSSIVKRKKYAGCSFLKGDIFGDKSKKYIYRYKETGEFDCAFETIQKAINATKKSHAMTVKKALVDGFLCAGYYWSYYKTDRFESHTVQVQPAKVAQYDQDGKLIKVWDTLKECSQEYPKCLRVCQGKLNETQGYIFKFLD